MKLRLSFICNLIVAFDSLASLLFVMKLFCLWMLNFQEMSAKDFNIVYKFVDIFRTLHFFTRFLAPTLLDRHVHWLVKGLAVVHSWVLICNLVRLAGGWFAEYSQLVILHHHEAESLDVHGCRWSLQICSIWLQEGQIRLWLHYIWLLIEE